MTPIITDPFVRAFYLVDSIVELYLNTVIEPFLKFHEIFYNRLNVILRKLMDDNKDRIPNWCTANAITYARTVMVIPCLIFLSWNWYLLPCLIVLLVDFGDFLDGVAARFWIDVHKERQEILDKKDDRKSRPNSPASSDSSFEFISTGSPLVIESWGVNHRTRTYGGFVDAVCDKAFVVPCWIMLLHNIPTTSCLKWFQYFCFFWLILAEVASGCVRFRAYYTSTGVSTPKVEGFDFSTSAVKADHVGKAKQTFEMVGTALYIIPLTTYLGLVFLFLSVPLAYESVRRKVKKRVIYVHSENTESFDHKTIKFWMQAKGMGSKLIVGVTDPKKVDMILNACATACVDEIIADAPVKADQKFLEVYEIDYVLSSSTQALFVTDEVVIANCCLVLGDDGVVRPLKSKTEHTD